MKKKIFVMLVLLLAMCYGLTWLIPAGAQAEPMPTATRSATMTATSAPGVCLVTSGADRGTVNVRTCAGTSCEVLEIVNEGESLAIVSAGLWNQIITDDGNTGWINSLYCKIGE